MATSIPDPTHVSSQTTRSFPLHDFGSPACICPPVPGCTGHGCHRAVCRQKPDKHLRREKPLRAVRERPLHTHQDGWNPQTDTATAGQDSEKPERAHTAGRGVKRCSRRGKQSGRSSEVKYEVTMGPSSSTPIYLPQRNQNVHTSVSAALFIRAQSGNNAGIPEWMDTLYGWTTIYIQLYNKVSGY